MLEGWTRNEDIRIAVEGLYASTDRCMLRIACTEGPFEVRGGAVDLAIYLTMLEAEDLVVVWTDPGEPFFFERSQYLWHHPVKPKRKWPPVGKVVPIRANT